MASSYHDRLIENIKAQAAARGIPEDDLGDVKEALEEKYGGELVTLPDRKLRAVQQGLASFFEEYLGGKRAGVSVEEAEDREEWSP